MSSACRVGVDTVILISLAVVDCLDLLGKIPGVEFVTTDVNIEELDADMQQIVAGVLEEGALSLVTVASPEDVWKFALEADRADPGEAALLAWARGCNAAVMTNDLGAMRVASNGDPPVNSMTIEALLVEAVHAGLLTPDEVLAMAEQLREESQFVPFQGDAQDLMEQLNVESGLVAAMVAASVGLG